MTRTTRAGRTARSLAAAVTAAAVLALAACGGGGGATESGQSADVGATRVVETPLGAVEIPADPQRVVVLNYALAGYLYNLDVPVAATIPEDAKHASGEFSPMWGDAPKEEGTRFLPWSPDGFDLEAVLEMEPDLIVAGGWGFPHFQAEAAYEDLSAIAPTVLVDKAFTDWQEQAEFLAVDVFGDAEAYAEMVRAYDERVTEVREAIEVPAQPTSFISVTADGTPYLMFEGMGLPLMFDELGFTTDDVVARNGLDPYQPGGDMAELSTEQLGQLITGQSLFVMGFNGETTSVAELSGDPAWRNLPSFRSSSAFDLPYWAVRHDFDEALALLDLVEGQFAR